MSSNRRDFFARLSSLSAGLFAGRRILSAQQSKDGMGQMDMRQGAMQQRSMQQPAANVRVTPGAPTSRAATTFVPVTTPDVGDLPFTMDAGIKVFNLVAEPVKQVIVPVRTFDLWGFNGSAPGPT